MRRLKMKRFLLSLFLLLCIIQPTIAEDRITYIHHDGLGNPVAATDEKGHLEWRIEYYPFGAELSNTQIRRNNNLGYSGKPLDRETGLSNYGARYRDPLSGRFMGIDPVNALDSVASNPMMFNRYAYANNNPYKYVDPDGANPKLIADFALNVTFNYLTTGKANLLGAAQETIVGALNPAKTFNKAKRIVGIVQKNNKATKKAEQLRNGKDVRVNDVKEAREILDSMTELRPGPGNVTPGMRDRRNSYRGDLINTKDPTSPRIHDKGKHADQPHYNLDIRDENGVRHKPAIIIDE